MDSEGPVEVWRKLAYDLVLFDITCLTTLKRAYSALKRELEHYSMAREYPHAKLGFIRVAVQEFGRLIGVKITRIKLTINGLMILICRLEAHCHLIIFIVFGDPVELDTLLTNVSHINHLVLGLI